MGCTVQKISKNFSEIYSPARLPQSSNKLGYRPNINNSDVIVVMPLV